MDKKYLEVRRSTGEGEVLFKLNDVLEGEQRTSNDHKYSQAENQKASSHLRNDLQRTSCRNTGSKKSNWL